MNLCTHNVAVLPAHIITHILGYLKLEDFKNASIICKSWHYASTDPRIVRNLIIRPKEDNFSQICQSNRAYGILILENLRFEQIDSYYFDFFKKFCPFVYELRIYDSKLKLHHLLKLLELMTRLEVLSFSRSRLLVSSPGLFPIEYDCEAKNRIVQNLSGIKNIQFSGNKDIPLIADLVRYGKNLTSFKFNSENLTTHYIYQEFFTIFENQNVDSLRHIDLRLICTGSVEDFITKFDKIKNLNLKSFNIFLDWNWVGGVYKSLLFQQFVMKLQSLEDLTINELKSDQLSLICRHLLNLKSLKCHLRGNDQPFSELGNLKQLEILRCNSYVTTPYKHSKVNSTELDKLFKCKFDNLRIFIFHGFVTGSNLAQFCENHPNMIELHLTILTRNLEMIFKHLTKLRILKLFFGSTINSVIDEKQLEQQYEYKITRLQNLEHFYIQELVNGIHEDDVRQLTKLRITNLSKFFVSPSLIEA